MMKKELIKIKDVWKKYDMGSLEPLVVLKEINLSVYEGEFIAITGPSGSGKSTMMNIVGALDIPSWGQVDLKGRNVSTMSESELATLRGKTIGFIFQQFNLLPTLSALKNVMLPMEMIDIDTDVARKRAEYLLGMLGLGDRIHHRPNELSGGQQQRVAIARSLANDAPIVLADEPTGNLDSKTGKFVMEFLGNLSREKGKTIILITHDLDLVKYASRVVYIRDGRVEKITQNKGFRLSCKVKMKGGKK